jgi:hypothetical protein
LTDDLYEVEKEGKQYKFHNCSILKCPNCDTVYLPDLVKIILEQILKMDSELDVTDFDFRKIRHTFLNDEFIFTEVEFLYDKYDYYFLPGLWRQWNTGFLTPVFFNIEVLLKFAHHPRYSLELGADTYGNIYKDGEHLISFGINRNGKVIMWLGDLGRLDVNEQHYLRSENIESDHDIASEFYQGQIEVIWAEPSLENRLLKKRLDLHECVMSNFSVSLSQLEPESIQAASKIVKPIVSTEKAFADVIIPMNMVFVESINAKDIKRDLKQHFEDIKLDGLGGLKLLQLWIEKRLGNVRASDIVSPLFILYDLRIAMAHLQSVDKKEELLSFACERLGLERTTRDYVKIYETLLSKLHEMYDKLLQDLRAE